jgi:hypothetical protein
MCCSNNVFAPIMDLHSNSIDKLEQLQSWELSCHIMTLKKIDRMLVEWWLKTTFSLIIGTNFASFWPWVWFWGFSCGKSFISTLLLALNEWPTSCNEIRFFCENYNLLAMDWNTQFFFWIVFLWILWMRLFLM